MTRAWDEIRSDLRGQIGLIVGAAPRHRERFGELLVEAFKACSSTDQWKNLKAELGLTDALLANFIKEVK